jgi:hypothetical protein
MALTAYNLYYSTVRADAFYAEVIRILPSQGVEAASARVRFGEFLVWAVLIWCAWLVILLRVPYEAFALAWAVLLVLGACDIVYVMRIVRSFLADSSKADLLRVLLSYRYRAWRVVYDGMVLVGGCLALMLPG